MGDVFFEESPTHSSIFCLHLVPGDVCICAVFSRCQYELDDIVVHGDVCICVVFLVANQN
jgi:hypothetical protein